MPVTSVKSKSEIDQIIKGTRNNLVVIYFFHMCCGPTKCECEIFKSKMLHLSEELTDVLFLKIDVDSNCELCEDLAMTYRVISWPAFLFF